MSNELTKTDLAKNLAAQSDLSLSDASQQLNAVLQTLEDALAAGHKIVLKGFGRFEVKDRPARTGRNPSTGMPMEIAASKAINFKAGKALKEAVNTVAKD